MNNNWQLFSQEQSPSFLRYAAQYVPYISSLISNTNATNFRRNIFQQKSLQPRTNRLIERFSVTQQAQQIAAQQAASFALNFSRENPYSSYIYAEINRNKEQRLLEYRRMASYAELADCLDEICDECLVEENGQFMKLTFSPYYHRGSDVQEIIQKEFARFIKIFELDLRGWEYFRRLLIEGELYFENIVDEEHLEKGILGLVQIPSEYIEPVYQDSLNDILECFLYRRAVGQNQTQIFTFEIPQITYIHSGIWDETHSFRLPFIENTRRAYKQLILIEDAIVIYRLVRAPERLVFKVYTGNMPTPKAESYIQSLMQKFWTRKTFSSSQGGFFNSYNPQSTLDAFWCPQDAQGRGVDVTTLPSGGALNEIKDLDYFLTKLYKSLKVPISRFLVAGDPFKDGAEITRDELRFARFIMRLQQQFASGIKQTFVTHLKLKKMWSQFELSENSFIIKFNVPTTFMAIREQQKLERQFNNYASALQQNGISQSFAQKYFLNWSLEMMKENRQWLRQDAALKWELSKIEEMGPNYREQILGTKTNEEGGEEGSMPSFSSSPISSNDNMSFSSNEEESGETVSSFSDLSVPNPKIPSSNQENEITS